MSVYSHQTVAYNSGDGGTITIRITYTNVLYHEIYQCNITEHLHNGLIMGGIINII